MRIIELKPHEVELIELLRQAEDFDTVQIAVREGTWAIVHKKEKKKVIHFDKKLAHVFQVVYNTPTT